MKFPHFPFIKDSRAWPILARLILVLAAFICFQQQCKAQQQMISPPDLSVDPLKYVTWYSAPQKVTVGDVADLNIPDGYRATDLDGAQMLLESLHDPVPNDLVGIFAPASGRWMAILEYSPDGYVKIPDVTQIDTNAILKQVLIELTEQQGPSSVKSLSWQSPPTYDAGGHLLKWSFRIVTASGDVLNQTAVMFGRRGFLQITVAQPFSLGGPPPLKQVVGNIRFKDGERYTDYQNGDIVAEIGMTELISGEKQEQAAGSFNGESGTVAAWVYCGLAVCLITGGVAVVIRRNRRHRRRHRRRTHAPAPVRAIKSQAPVKAPSTNPPSVVAKSGETSGQVPPNPVSNFSKWPKPFYQKKRRKRLFDYPKFYTRVMSELSGHTYVPANTSNGKLYSNGHANGQRNGDVNGQTNGHSNGHAPSNGSNGNQTVKSEIEDLIAMQKMLTRLLEQQIRQTEEKRGPIEEQTTILKIHPVPTADQQQVV